MAAPITVSDQMIDAGLKRAEIALVVTRADGTVEDLGTVAADAPIFHAINVICGPMK